MPSDSLALFHPAVRDWFTVSFRAPTRAQEMGWPAIASGDWTLIFAPTGSGKTLTAFLWALDRLMFTPRPKKERRCRVLYVSPLIALAVDVERNLRAPLAGIANVAQDFVMPQIAIRTGHTPQRERARFNRHPADILITTPESLYLMLTSNAREMLRGVETVIVDEIHALVPNKRGAHLALSLERLALLCDKPPQRIGLSATQRPLEEVARFLGGFVPRESAGPGRKEGATLEVTSLGPSSHPGPYVPRESAGPGREEGATLEVTSLAPHTRPAPYVPRESAGPGWEEGATLEVTSLGPHTRPAPALPRGIKI